MIPLLRVAPGNGCRTWRSHLVLYNACAGLNAPLASQANGDHIPEVLSPYNCKISTSFSKLLPPIFIFMHLNPSSIFNADLRQHLIQATHPTSH